MKFQDIFCIMHSAYYKNKIDRSKKSHKLWVLLGLISIWSAQLLIPLYFKISRPPKR